MNKYNIKQVFTFDHHFLQMGFICYPLQGL